MRKTPGITVDWESNRVRFDPGEQLTKCSVLDRLQILASLSAQLNHQYERAFDEMYPHQRRVLQRMTNQARLLGVQALIGRTVIDAQALNNGAAAVSLSDGRTLAITATGRGIHFLPVISLEDAARTARTQYAARTFVDTPLDADLRHQEQIRNDIAQQHFLDIRDPDA